MSNLMNLKYFEKPTQVIFVNPDAPEDKCWSVGIAYKDEVIWDFNSWVFSMIEIYTVAQQRNCKNYIYPYSSILESAGTSAEGAGAASS